LNFIVSEALSFLPVTPGLLFDPPGAAAGESAVKQSMADTMKSTVLLRMAEPAEMLQFNSAASA
jgi:hypothetical protein